MPRLPRLDAGSEPRGRRRISGDGGDADCSISDAVPQPDPTQEDPGEDPREALVRRLLEHQRFKAAAELLHEKEIQRSALWHRPDGRVAEVVGEAPEPEIEVDLFSLMAAFRQVLERARARPRVILPPEQIPIETRIEQLLSRCLSIVRRSICGRPHRDAIVISRPVEMIRLKMVRVFQQANCSAIRVYKRAHSTGRC
jgi:segregation and condensation protein A